MATSWNNQFLPENRPRFDHQMDLLQKRKRLHSVTTKSYLFHHIKHSSHIKSTHEPFLPFWVLWAALHGELAGTALLPSKEPLSPHRMFRTLVNAFVPGNLEDFSFHSQTQSHAFYKCLTPPDIVIMLQWLSSLKEESDSISMCEDLWELPVALNMWQ